MDSRIDPALSGHPRRQLGARFVLGIATGVLLALTTSILPVIAIAATLAILVATVVAVRAGGVARVMALGGMLVGAGGTLLAAVGNTFFSCSATENFCGDANVAPLIAYSVALLGVGALTATIAARRTPGQP